MHHHVRTIKCKCTHFCHIYISMWEIRRMFFHVVFRDHPHQKRVRAIDRYRANTHTQPSTNGENSYPGDIAAPPHNAISRGVKAGPRWECCCSCWHEEGRRRYYLWVGCTPMLQCRKRCTRRRGAHCMRQGGSVFVFLPRC